jgi:redox-sensitive bicupin YhaK (pirin superfamily)
MSNFITSLRDNQVDEDVPAELPPLPKAAASRTVVKVLKPIKTEHKNGKLTWDWLPHQGQAHLYPFLHFGWVRMPAEAGSTGLHPHAGLELVTLLTRGSYRHESSSSGNHDLVTGSLEYQMTGSGIWHQEHSLGPEGFEAYQLTLALPKSCLAETPIYRVYAPDLIEHEKKADYGMTLLVGGLSPLKPRNNFSFVLVRLAASQKAHLPAVLGRQAFVCVVDGDGRFGEDQQPIQSGELGVLSAGEGLAVHSETMGLSFFLAAGEPTAD